MENIQQMSMLEVAVKLMNDKKTQQPISKIIKEVLEMKGIDDPNGDYASQLYLDITTSSLFVYMGDDEWNLKSRESLDEWDKDGSAFNSGDVEEDEDEDDVESVDDYYSIGDDEDEDSSSDEDSDDISEDNYDDDDEEDDTELESDDLVTETYDEDDEDEDDYMDEDSYNDIMDDYEDMYDKD